MTEEEFMKGKDELFDEANNLKEKVKNWETECALSNNEFKVGDIIADSTKVIQIERIEAEHFGWNFIFPQCIYYGKELTRKGLVPKKNPNPNAHIKQRDNWITKIR